MILALARNRQAAVKGTPDIHPIIDKPCSCVHCTFSEDAELRPFSLGTSSQQLCEGLHPHRFLPSGHSTSEDFDFYSGNGALS